MTERFHAAAQKLSASIARGKGGIVHVQQLFLEAQWYKSEACMVESWHSLSVSIREAQETSKPATSSSHCWRYVGRPHPGETDRMADMHRPAEGLPDFERELRKRMWCILWTWDWYVNLPG